MYKFHLHLSTFILTLLSPICVQKISPVHLPLHVCAIVCLIFADSFVRLLAISENRCNTVRMSVVCQTEFGAPRLFARAQTGAKILAFPDMVAVPESKSVQLDACFAPNNIANALRYSAVVLYLRQNNTDIDDFFRLLCAADRLQKPQ